MKIAIVGKMCSGKTTLANFILRFDKRFKKYSFGDGVKEIATTYFNMTHKNRSLLINIATKLKEIDNNIWINYLLNKINTNYCVIDDVRHQNELDILIKNNWYIIKLNVSNKEQFKRIKKIYPDTYNDHLKNLNDISEQCDTLIYPKGYPNLNINTEENFKKLNMTIISLLEKNKHN